MIFFDGVKLGYFFVGLKDYLKLYLRGDVSWKLMGSWLNFFFNGKGGFLGGF